VFFSKNVQKISSKNLDWKVEGSTFAPAFPDEKRAVMRVDRIGKRMKEFFERIRDSSTRDFTG